MFRERREKKLDELMKQYPDGEQPAVVVNNIPRGVVVDDIADVMQRAPA